MPNKLKLGSNLALVTLTFTSFTIAQTVTVPGNIDSPALESERFQRGTLNHDCARRDSVEPVRQRQVLRTSREIGEGGANDTLSQSVLSS
jgi:hypothetical protein